MPGLGGNRFSEANQASPPTELSNQLDVFHDRNFRITPNGFEISTARENRLITIRKAETPGAQVGPESDQPQTPTGRDDRQTKRSPNNPRISESLSDSPCGSRTELAVRVEK
jgi:hypothetical protein